MTTTLEVTRAPQPELHWNAVRSGAVTILDLFDHLPWFKGAADWTAWRSFLCAIYALPMTPAELAIFRACTGRQEPPKQKVSEAWVAVGRRGRKSAIGATIAVFEAGYHEHYYLAPGEIARVPIISKDKDDAKQIKNYAAAILQEPSLAHLLGGEIIGETIPLSNRCEIMIKAASLTAGRSRTIPCAIYDELAFWATSDNSVVPDVDIIKGVTPAMLTVPGAIQVGMSSPYAKRGVLWEKYVELWPTKENGFLESETALFWKAPTLTMHDTPQVRVYVRKQYEDDAVSAAAEIGSDFRDDVKGYITDVELASVTATGIGVRDYSPAHIYFAFVDPSGGKDDSMTLAISHYEDHLAVLDYVQEWPAPFDPKTVVAEQIEILKRYKLRSVVGDAYGGEWPSAEFRAHKVSYYLSDKTKNELYRELIPVFRSKSCLLLDLPLVKRQFTGLERKTRSGGKDVIDHRPGSHDDMANAVTGAILRADKLKPKTKEVEKELTLEEEHRASVRAQIQERIKIRQREDRMELEHERRHQQNGGDFSIGGGGI